MEVALSRLGRHVARLHSESDFSGNFIGFMSSGARSENSSKNMRMGRAFSHPQLYLFAKFGW